MRLSWKWLFEIYGISPSTHEWERVEAARTLLPLAGVEIAKIEKRGEGLADILVAKVEEVTKHPQADRLNLCRVNNGKEILQVVCGAANVRAGLTVALAPVGAKLPGGMEIKAAKIRGVDSNGMLCSESELGLAEKSEGILELPGALVVGQKFLDAVEVRDEVWELELTPDRADCLSTIGLARELRRYFGKDSKAWPEVRFPERDLIEQDHQGDVPIVKVEVQASKACPIYAAQLFEGFQAKQYSKLFADRLKTLGVERLRSGPVDLANYVLFELGHPMHTFDADQIVGSKIIVRFAKAGEKMTTIDNLERELSAEDLVIADIEKPIALAGVMGSKDSGVTEKTTRIVLESAYFDPEVVRATAKRHKISSDASHRFERGVNPHGVFEAAGRLSLLYRTQLGARRRGSFVVVKADKADKLFENKSINLDLRKVERTLGYEISAHVATEALSATLIPVQQKSSNVLTVDAPPFRWDLQREIDLVEEIARVLGYDKIPSRYPAQTKSFDGIATPIFDRWQEVRGAGLRAGFVEIEPYAFVSESERVTFTPNAQLPQLENPISEDWKFLRACLVPGILKNLSRHGSLRQKRVQVFESGAVFENGEARAGVYDKELKTRESLHVGWGLMGHREDATWLQDKASKTRDEYRNFFDAKGFWELLQATLLRSDGRWKNVELKPLWNFSAEELKKIPAWIPVGALHPGRSALITVPALRGVRGFVGELNPALVGQVLNFPAGWRFPVALGEVRVIEDLWDWKTAAELRQKLGVQPRIQINAPALTPVVERDISVVVSSTTSHDDVLKAIKKVATDLKEISCTDVYPISEDKKSLSFRLLLQSAERTLQDDEVQKTMDGVLSELTKSFGASLRA